MSDSHPIITTTSAVEIIATAERRGPRRFTTKAYTGGPIRVERYAMPIIVDLAGVAFPARPITANLHHDGTKIVGHVDSHQNTGRELTLSGPVSGTGEAAKEFTGNHDNGYPWQASIEARPLERPELVPAGSQVTVNGQTFTGPVLVARKSELSGIAFVPRGADENTSVSIAASLKGTNKMTTEHDTLTAERERMATICATCDAAASRIGHEPAAKIRANAIKAGWTDAELEVALLKAENAALKLEGIRADRPRGFEITSGRQGAGDREIIQAAFFRHLGQEAAGERLLGEDAMEAGAMLRATSMMDIFKAVLTAESRDIPASRDDIIKAGFSSTNLPGILSDSANKLLLDSYRSFPSVARLIAAKLSANDFKQHTGLRLTGDTKLLEVGAAGEIKSGVLTDQSYPFKVSTFARLLKLTRQEVINDDLSAFGQLPLLLGRGAAIALEELFWQLVLLNTGNFFHANNANLIDDVLDSDGLGAAVEAMLKQVDDQGHPVNVIPRFLVVPPELKKTADELFRSTFTNTGGGSSATQVPNANVFFGLYEPVTSPYLSNASYTGNSGTAWHLFGSPADVAAFGIAYLSGQESPVVEQVDLPATELGIGFRGYLDFGVCQVDPRGAIKSSGTV